MLFFLNSQTPHIFFLCSGRKIAKEINLALEVNIKIHFYALCDRFLLNMYHPVYQYKNLD